MTILVAVYCRISKNLYRLGILQMSFLLFKTFAKCLVFDYFDLCINIWLHLLQLYTTQFTSLTLPLQPLPLLCIVFLLLLLLFCFCLCFRFSFCCCRYSVYCCFLFFCYYCSSCCVFTFRYQWCVSRSLYRNYDVLPKRHCGSGLIFFVLFGCCWCGCSLHRTSFYVWCIGLLLSRKEIWHSCPVRLLLLVSAAFTSFIAWALVPLSLLI